MLVPRRWFWNMAGDSFFFGASFLGRWGHDYAILGQMRSNVVRWSAFVEIPWLICEACHRGGIYFDLQKFERVWNILPRGSKICAVAYHFMESLTFDYTFRVLSWYVPVQFHCQSMMVSVLDKLGSILKIYGSYFGSYFYDGPKYLWQLKRNYRSWKKRLNNKTKNFERYANSGVFCYIETTINDVNY